MTLARILEGVSERLKREEDKMKQEEQVEQADVLAQREGLDS